MSISLFMFLAIVGVGFGTAGFFHSISLYCQIEKLRAEVNELEKEIKK